MKFFVCNFYSSHIIFRWFKQDGFKKSLFHNRSTFRSAMGEKLNIQKTSTINTIKQVQTSISSYYIIQDIFLFSGLLVPQLQKSSEADWYTRKIKSFVTP